MNYPIKKRKHKYYLCECGNEIKVIFSMTTAQHGLVEYMKCSNCCERGQRMVAVRGVFEGYAAR